MLRRRSLLAAPLALAAGGAQAQDRQLQIGLASEPSTLDPAFSRDAADSRVFGNLHESLLMAQPDGSVAAGLAEFSVKDALTYVFTLKPNLTFHDGTPIDAAAAKAAIERYADPAGGSARQSEFGPFAGVEVTGRLVFAIRLSAPYAPLPLVLAGRAGMLVSPKAPTTGAGAFKLVSWTRNAELVLEKFPGYWRGDKHGFDRLVYRPIADAAARLAGLRSGTLQLIDGLPPQAVGPLTREAGVRVSQLPGLKFEGWSLNCTRPPLDDIRVRRALLRAVDADAIHRVVYFATGQVAHGPLSPAVGWAFDPNFTPPGHDPVRAKQMLVEAGLTLPLPVVIIVTNAPEMVRIAQIIQAQTAEAGFRMEVRQLDPASLATVLQQRDFDLCLSPGGGHYDPDGNTFDYFTEGGSKNFMGYDSDAETELLGQARSLADRSERARQYHQAQALLAEDAPMLFLHFDAVLQAAAAKLAWTAYPDGAWRLYDAKMG